MSPRARRFFGCALPLAFVLAGCGVLFMLTYAVQVVIHIDDVRDEAMAPALRPGMTVLTNNTAFWYEDPYRPAIVTVGRPEGRVFRRIVGVPGETVQIRDNQVMAGDETVLRLPASEPFPDMEPVTLGPGEYFVLANQADQADSREWGPVERRSIYGVATFYRTPRSDGWQVIEPAATPAP